MKYFGEDNSGLKLTFDVARRDNSFLKCITNKVTINFDILCSFMKNRIGSEVKNRLSVPIKNNGTVNSNMKIFKELSKYFNSHKVIVIDRYSTYAKDRETMYCSLVFQKRGELPKETK